MSGLKQQTLEGVRWMGVAQVAGQAARFGFAVLLARLVPPQEFGLFQMAVVFTSFAAVLCDVGLGAALIQRPAIEERQLTATFWLSATVSVGLAAVLCAAAVPIARFYGHRTVGLLVCVVSADFILSSLAIVHRALLIRAMDYRRLAAGELAGIFAGGALASVLALAGGGVWSLAALSLGTTAATTAALWWLQPWRPAFVLRGMVRRELLGFGLHLQGFNVVNYWLRNLDKFLIGKFFGDAPLGLYMRAYTTMLLPQTQITSVLERVMWPALARCSGDVDRLRAAYLRALRLVCFVSFPMMLGLLLVADDFVRLLYGAAWAGCVPALRLLCIAGLAQAPVATLGWLYLATGRTRRLLGWGIGAGLAITGGIVAGLLRGGIADVAGCYAAVTVALIVPAFIVAAPCARLSFAGVFRALAGSLAVSLCMAALVAALLRALPAACPAAPRLLLAAAGGAVFYGGAAWLLRLGEARELVDIVRTMLRRRVSA